MQASPFIQEKRKALFSHASLKIMKLNHDCIYINAKPKYSGSRTCTYHHFQSLMIKFVIFGGSSVNSGIKSRVCFQRQYFRYSQKTTITIHMNLVPFRKLTQTIEFYYKLLYIVSRETELPFLNGALVRGIKKNYKSYIVGITFCFIWAIALFYADWGCPALSCLNYFV